MHLEPLTIQQCNWSSYIKMYTDYFNNSPTRCLDDAGIKLDRPEAFLKSIDASFHGYALSHLSFSFICYSSITLLQIQQNTRLAVMSKETEERDKFVSIISGTLEHWRSCFVNMDDCINKEINEFTKQARSFLKMAGYRLEK